MLVLAMEKKTHTHRSTQISLAPSLARSHDTPIQSINSQIGLSSVPLYNKDEGNYDSTYIYRSKIYTDKVVIYRAYLNPSSRSEGQISNNCNLSRGKYNGWISKNAARKIRMCLEGWIKSVQVNRQKAGSRYKPKHSHITFPTLTLPSKQIHSDNELKREILMPFIQRLQRELGVKEYFWKMEPQKNGNAHFHLLTDRYIDKDLLNNYWNMSCEKLGYLSRYFEKSGSLYPPSTNIRVCPKGMSLVRYVMKYVTKSPIKLPSFHMVDGVRVKKDHFYCLKRDEVGAVIYSEWRKMSGRVWGMSKGLKECDTFNADGSYRYMEFINTLEWDPDVKVKHDEHFSIYYCNTQSKLFQYDKVLLNDYRRFYLDQYVKLYLNKDEVKKVEIPVIKFCSKDPPRVRNLIQKRLSLG